MEYLDGKEVAEALSRCANNFGPEKGINKFVETIMRDHRTLQQTMFRFMLQTIYRWSEQHDSGMFDGRNEFTVKTCKKIVEALKDDYVFNHKGRAIVPFI